MTFKLECIRDETINNLTVKRVVCPSVVWNVGIAREDQNDQVSNRGLLAFLGVSRMEVMNLLVLIKTMWQARLV